jgi:predicted transcriptional regulator
VTTLNRLRKKGLVDRIAVEGTKVVTFRYVPRFTMAEVERDVASNAIRQVLGLGVAGPLLLSRMVEEISEHDAELLEELGRLVDEKRRNSPSNNANMHRLNWSFSTVPGHFTGQSAVRVGTGGQLFSCRRATGGCMIGAVFKP